MLVRNSDDIRTWLAGEVQEKVVIRITEFLYEEVIRLSPVDTGQFRASWNISVGAPNFDTVNSGSGLRAPERVTLKFSKDEFPIVYVANGKHYGPYLENGWSRQAPHGMIKVAMAHIQTVGRFL